LIVGTAGHIDHGKTALLHALTGQQGDRRREERERGITIDLGYLYADLGEGSLTGFIDVPGHERFVHNMLAGQRDREEEAVAERLQGALAAEELLDGADAELAVREEGRGEQFGVRQHEEGGGEPDHDDAGHPGQR